MKQKIILVFLSIILASALVSAVDYSNCPMGGMMSGFYGGYGYGMMIFSWLFGVLTIIALVLAIIWLYKQINKKS